MLFDKYRIDYWLSRDLWSEADFTMLLVGEDERVYPEGWYDTQEGKDFLSKRNEAAKCISQAVLAKVLPCVCPTDASAADKLYGVARYFRPREAITWARSKPIFGDFPFMSLLPDEVGYTSRKVSKAPPPVRPIHSSGSSVISSSKPVSKETMPPPNWSEWQLMPKLHIWQAVALSLSVDPYTVETKSLNWFGDDGKLKIGAGGYSNATPPKCMVSEDLTDFNTRLKQAMNAAKVGTFEVQRYQGEMHGFSFVMHGHFWKWAKKVGWSIPDEMMNLPEEATPETIKSNVHAQDNDDSILLKRVIGAIALALVEAKGKQLLNGEKENVSAIAKVITTTLNRQSGVSLRGLGDTNLRTIVGESLSTLKSVRDVPDN